MNRSRVHSALSPAEPHLRRVCWVWSPGVGRDFMGRRPAPSLSAEPGVAPVETDGLWSKQCQLWKREQSSSSRGVQEPVGFCHVSCSFWKLRSSRRRRFRGFSSRLAALMLSASRYSALVSGALKPCFFAGCSAFRNEELKWWNHHLSNWSQTNVKSSLCCRCNVDLSHS